MAASASNEVLHDLFPLIREYKNGRIERCCGTEFVPASVDPETLAQSKDVEIAPEINLSVRIFLPNNATPANKLPLLLYFHGGGFVVESAFSPRYTKHLNLLVAAANVVAVSLNYRLAPENPLPAAYEDSWLALKWIASQSSDEQWIKEYADLNNVYLGGDSAGGNIASNVAIRFGTEKLDGVNLSGVFLNCPFFCGKDSIGNEETHPIVPKSYLDKLWHYACPETTGCDDPRINPANDRNLWRFGCKRLLVYVAEKETLRERGWLYKETISKSGWDGDVEVVQVQGEDHVFSVLFPTSENSRAMIRRVASFLNHRN